MFSRAKTLPKVLTSYDLLKSFALIIMLIDHVGMYLYPEQNEWRVIGRMSMPVWLFLIGYAQTRELSKLLWLGGGVLVLSTFIFGESIFSLNILFTILLVRMFLDAVMTTFLKNSEGMIMVTLAVIILVLPTSFIVDYGSHAMLFAMFGYLVRHQKELNFSNIKILIFMGVVVIVHSLYQQLVFGFSANEAILAAAGILAVCIFMTNFQAVEYANLTNKLPKVAVWSLQMMGRHSLEFYVIHLLILKIISILFFSEPLSWFQWAWI